MTDLKEPASAAPIVIPKNKSLGMTCPHCGACACCRGLNDSNTNLNDDTDRLLSDEEIWAWLLFMSCICFVAYLFYLHVSSDMGLIGYVVMAPVIILMASILALVLSPFYAVIIFGGTIFLIALLKIASIILSLYRSYLTTRSPHH